MSSFRNTLQKDDRVMHAVSGRFGKVYNQPRESSRNIAVVLDDTKTAQYFDVLGLRFVPPGGLPELIAPTEGELPAQTPAAPKDEKRPPHEPDQIATLFRRKKSCLLDLLVVEEAILRLELAQKTGKEAASFLKEHGL